MTSFAVHAAAHKVPTAFLRLRLIPVDHIIDQTLIGVLGQTWGVFRNQHDSISHGQVPRQAPDALLQFHEVIRNEPEEHQANGGVIHAMK